MALVQRSPQRLAHLGKAECLPPSLGQVRLEPIIAREEFSPQGGALSLQIERRFPCMFSLTNLHRTESLPHPNLKVTEGSGRGGWEGKAEKTRTGKSIIEGELILLMAGEVTQSAVFSHRGGDQVRHWQGACTCVIWSYDGSPFAQSSGEGYRLSVGAPGPLLPEIGMFSRKRGTSTYKMRDNEFSGIRR